MIKKILGILTFALSICSAQSAVDVAPISAPASTTPAAQPLFSGVRTPLFVGGALGFGSGTGVGNDRGIGLRQIEPMFGVWYPGLGYLRVGYGMFDYKESADIKIEVEHSELNFELAAQLFGDAYIAGNYSRVKELSDLGDIAWNEWGLGVGSMLSIFSRTILFAEVGYRWVLSHYDPFENKKVDGGRLQLNLGFAAFVY